MESNNEILLSIPKGQEQVSKGMDDLVERFDVSIDKLEQWFKRFSIESIEIHISGVVETSGLTKLIVSAKAEGGIKVVLKPKDKVIRIS